VLRPDRLLDMANRFIFFDQKLGKMVARYQQVQGAKSNVAQRKVLALMDACASND
jgi:type I restriction enzyme R subunit